VIPALSGPAANESNETSRPGPAGTPGRREGLPRRPALLSLALALAVAALCLGGCRRNSAPVLLDEAFVAARPGLASSFRSLQGGVLGKGGAYAEIGLARGPEELVGEARKAGFAAVGQGRGAIVGPEELVGEARKAGFAAVGQGRGAIVTSPLLAAALVAGEKALGLGGSMAEGGGIQALGGLGLVVPEWQGGPLPQVTPVNTEPSKAFESAGRAAGAFIAALRRSGQASATGGLLFRETPSRGREALEAFSRGFLAAAGVEPAIEVLGKGETMDESVASVGRLLAVDLRIVLVATGRDARAACKALDRPGLAVGIESPDPADWPRSAFAIVPDDRGLAQAAIAAAERLGKAPGSRLGDIGVPALLLAYPGAGSFPAGDADLGRLLAAEGAIRTGKPPSASAGR